MSFDLFGIRKKFVTTQSNILTDLYLKMFSLLPKFRFGKEYLIES